MSEQGMTLDDYVNTESETVELGPRSLQLPEQWDSTEFGKVFSHQRGVNYSSDNYVSEGEGMIFLTLNAIAPGGGFKKDSLKFYEDDIPEEKITTEGDILMANTDLNQDGEIIGYPVRVPSFESNQKKCFSHHLLKIQQNNSTYNSHFLEYLLSAKYIHDRMIAFSCGSTVLNLNTGLLEKLELPVPPLKEQRKIASVLYTVDQAIQKTETVIDQIKQVRKGLLQDLMERGVEKERNLRPPASEAPSLFEKKGGRLIPSSWEIKKLADIGEWVSGKTPRRSESSYWGGSIPWITAKDMKTLRVEETEDSITEVAVEEGAPVVSSDNSIMVLVRGMILDHTLPVVRPVRDASFNQDVKSILPHEEVDPDYLAYWLDSHSGEVLGLVTEASHGTKRLSTESFGNLTVQVPPLNEQKSIVERIKLFDRRVKNEELYVEQLEKLKQGLMQDLLSGEVRTHDKNIEIIDDVLQHG